MNLQPVKIAIIQQAPVYLDLSGSIEKLGKLARQAAGEGAQLIVFGETWLCGYPAWLDHCPEIALWGHRPTEEVFRRMQETGVEVPGPATRLLEQIAVQHQVYIVIGVNEVVRTGPGNGTIFNALLIFDPEGRLVVHHRKLMPTYTEKLVYGTGDGYGLRAIDTPYGRLGGLICWEHWMPLTRQAMHEHGEHIHIALWPAVKELHQLATRHYAFEGRCFVIAVGQILRVSDMPGELKLPGHLASKPEEYLLNGGSCVVGPDGSFLLEPQFNREGVYYVDIPDPGEVYRQRMTMDVTGHYNRPDVFRFETDRRRQTGKVNETPETNCT